MGDAASLRECDYLETRQGERRVLQLAIGVPERNEDGVDGGFIAAMEASPGRSERRCQRLAGGKDVAKYKASTKEWIELKD